MKDEISRHKVAVFSNTFWSIYNFRMEFIRTLREAGAAVVFISADDKYKPELEKLGYETITLKYLDGKSTSILKEAKLILEIRKIFSSYSFDFIYTFTIKPNLYSTIANFNRRKKIIITVNGLGNAFSTKGLINFVSLRLFQYAFSNAYRIVFQNKDDFNFFQQRIRLDNQKVLFVRGSGVNLKQFTISKRISPGNSLHFLLACRLLKEKGIYEYIQAAENIKKAFPSVEFWLIGMKANNKSAVNITELEPYAEKGIIKILPPTDDINYLLEQVDVLVLPSYYNEGVPRILLEGLSKGLPIITTNSVGCRETVIQGKNGYLIEPRSVQSLEYAINQFLCLSAEERQEMGMESRRLAEGEFDESKVIANYMNLLPHNELIAV